MKKYTAINIGPIIASFGLAQKPRELWAASFIFSYLMEKIIEKINTESFDLKLISPTLVDRSDKSDQPNNGVGLYPDRAFFEGSVDLKDLSRIHERVKRDVAGKVLGIEIDDESTHPLVEYFNIMVSTVEAQRESEAIEMLNKQLDIVELCDTNRSSGAEKELVKLIKKRKDSNLFDIANSLFTGGVFDVYPLASYAAVELLSLEKSMKLGAGDDNQQETFYKNLETTYKDRLKSRHKYICIVQADGDNVGKIVSHKDLSDGAIANISDALLTFGKKACSKIEQYGGLPIYAGGDDLLFIAPVVGGDRTHIFDLIDSVDKEFSSVKNLIDEYKLTDDGGKEIIASMSYGVSITYYKHPLYEAWEAARNLLFDVAKNQDGKNAVAWKLQKHSGSTLEGAMSKTPEPSVYSKFGALLGVNADEKDVSAVAHKLRELEDVLVLLKAETKDLRECRIDALFDNVLDASINSRYKNQVKSLLVELVDNVQTSDLTKMIYGMLRTAKFIKGEDFRDE